MDAGRVEIGVVRSVQPGRREVRVEIEPLWREAMAGAEWLHVVPRGGPEQRCRVTQMRDAGDALVLTLAPGVPRDVLAGFRGARVLAAEGMLESARPELAGPEWVGWTVLGPDGQACGSVAEVYVTPMNAAVTLMLADGRRRTFPVIPEVIAQVDAAAGVIRLHDVDAYGVDI